jgi:hypothetical protein
MASLGCIRSDRQVQARAIQEYFFVVLVLLRFNFDHFREDFRLG